MNDLPGEDCYPGGVSARDVDESQGIDEDEARREAWYDYQDNEDGDE